MRVLVGCCCGFELLECDLFLVAWDVVGGGGKVEVSVVMSMGSGVIVLCSFVLDTWIVV